MLFRSLRIVAIVAVIFCVLGAVILGFYDDKGVTATIEEAHKIYKTDSNR